MSLTPRKRYAAALTVTPDNSQLIMYGGCLVSSSEKFDCALKTNEMWSLSLRDYTWRLLNNQTAIAGGVQAQVGPGAIVGDVYYAYYNAYVYKYSLKSNTWLDLPARIEGANFRSMTDRDEGLLFAGGLEGAGTSSSVSQLQVDINKPLFVNWTDLPVKVRNPGLFSTPKKIVR
ncbi:hypothetical protein HK098_005462 [Nowakowskiella sp. JEL0407]|nr:hypothetical protein HK098_005462 [Nowakowskiella sp. JEL0407]